jgi:hypothetical protein
MALGAVDIVRAHGIRHIRRASWADLIGSTVTTIAGGGVFPKIWRASIVNLGGFVVLAIAYWALSHSSNIYAFGPGLIALLLIYVWIGIAIVKAVSEFGRTCDSAAPTWESGAALALPLIPLSLFWQTLSLDSTHTVFAVVAKIGLVIAWALATFGIGVVARLGLWSADAPTWALTGVWFILCMFYGVQTMIKV